VKSKKYVYVGIAVTVVVVAVLLVLTQSNTLQVQQSTPTGISAYTLELSYEGVNSDLRSTLSNQQINMSKPLKFFTQADLTQYCNFLSNKTKQAMIEYCTSTELKDFHGAFLGNINMIGSTLAPVLIIAALQTDPLFSNYDEIKTAFGDVVNETICQCWDKERPGSYPTLSSMMDALRAFHVNGTKPDSTTHGVPLGGVHFEIEITTNDKGYVWKLLVAKK
jgi:hypothetical protein